MKRKNFLQYGMASLTLILGHVLVFVDFFLSYEHIIHEPTLWYFGQCCILFGCVFGVIKYVDSRFDSLNR